MKLWALEALAASIISSWVQPAGAVQHQRRSEVTKGNTLATGSSFDWQPGQCAAWQNAGSVLHIGLPRTEAQHGKCWGAHLACHSECSR